MMFEIAALIGGVATLVADSSKALLEWNPTTFYIASAVVQTPLIWGVYQMLGAEPQYNTWPSALASAAVGNVLAYFLRDLGVPGAVGIFCGYFAILLITAGFDIFRTLMVFFITIGSYAGLAHFVIPRTPLNAYTINGVPKVLVTGGFKAEPIERRDPKDPEVPSEP